MLARLYRGAQILSLDIVLGAVILLRFFSSTLSVYPSWSVYLLLAISVWLIYTLDHLRDASKAEQSVRARYQFHRTHRKKLHIVVGLMLAAACACVYFTPAIILLSGGFLVVLSCVYLVIQHLLAKWGMKELYVSIIYTSGILLAPFVLSETFDGTLFLLLFLLTFLNLVLFSWFEREADKEDGFTSIATVYADRYLQAGILLLLSMGIAFSFLLPLSRTSFYFQVAFLVYAMLYIGHKRWEKNQGFRAIGDGVFLLPILFELI